MSVTDPKWLKAELAKPGRSQSGLARHMGLDSSAINRLVNGGRELKAREIEQIEDYLGHDVPHNLGGTDELGTPEPAGEPSAIADRIQERLDALGLTPITAATRAGLPRDTIRNLLRGRASFPRADTLQGIARALVTSSAYLLGEVDAAAVEPASHSSERSAAAARLKQARIAAGFTTASDAARQVGLRDATVRAHESGQNGYGAADAAKYAKLYKVGVNWLVYGCDEEPSPPAEDRPRAGRRRVRLAFDDWVSPTTALKILALIEEEAS